MGKPAGTYLTLESPNLAVADEKQHAELTEQISQCIWELIEKQIRRMEPKKNVQTEAWQTDRTPDWSVLVVGLGNREVTPDALGPYVADHLRVTRHIIQEYGKYAMGEDEVCMVSAIVPGVMGQTGMETAEIVRGIVE